MIEIDSWIATDSAVISSIPAFLFRPNLTFLTSLANKGNTFMIHIKDTKSNVDKKVLCTFDQATNFGPCPSNLTFRKQYYVGFLKEEKFKNYPLKNGSFEF